MTIIKSEQKKEQFSISIEDFFFDDLDITPENPWNPLPKHSLEQSPCYPIIGIHNKYRVPFYYCKLHPHIENIYLENIEHHCKYKEPDIHKAEILRFLKKILANHKVKNKEKKQKNKRWIYRIKTFSGVYIAINQ